MTDLIFGRTRPRSAYSGKRQRTTPNTIKRWLLGVVFVLVFSPLLAGLYSITRAGESARVYAATSSTLNFQGRLLSSSGSLVNDGSYSIEFKLYDAVTGGTNEWTETQTVTIKNGYFSAGLGGVTPFSSTIDWSQEKWLTMNVNSDGEMTPRIKLTAVPYALRSGLATSATNLTKTVGGFTGVLDFGTLTNNRTYTLPDASGTICLTTTCAGGGLSFMQDGNAYGEDGVLGTTDTFGLRFITDNTERFTILANGNVGVGDTTPAALFTVGTNDALQIDANGNLLTTGTITSGAINGQDIDATANLTGTLTVAGLTTLNGGLTLEAGDIFSFNGESFTDLTGVGLTNNAGVLGLANTAVSPGSYGSSTSVPNFTVDAQGRLIAAGSMAISNLANSALQNSSINLNYGSNLSGDGSVALGGTLNINFSANPSLTTLTTSGAINGQTISNVAILTGTLDVAGLITANGGVTFGSGDTLTINGEGFTDLTGTGLTNNAGVLGLANTAVMLGSYGSSSAVPTFTVDAQGRLTAAGTTTLANSALQNSSIGLSYGTNLSGSASVALGGTLSINFSATPTFTSVITGTVTNAGILNLTATGAGNDIVLNGADRVEITAGTSIELLSNTNLTGNLDISGTLTVGTNNALTVDANGSLTATFRVLDGSRPATAASGLSPGTIQLGAGNTANFDVGNYVQVNGMYAKITSKTASALSITPNLTWANGATVTEYYIPEIGGTDTGSALTSRFGRGYFISGVATGNGTTYYNEDGITTSLSTFNIANENVTTLNIGGSATTLTIGNASSTVSILGSLETSASETITAGGGLVVGSGGITNNGGGITGAGTITGVTGLTFTSGGLNLASGGITNAGALAGVTSLTASGSITAATSNTINGLSVSGGALSGVTGITFTSGGLNLNNGGITNAGAIGGVAGLTLTSGNLALGGGNITGAGSISGTSLGVTGGITAATSNTINGLSINSGALSGVSTISASGAITAATATNTINGLVINSGALSSITTISASGSITAATSSTINGLSINSGSLSGITGFSQTTGAFSVTGTGGITVGGGSNALTIDSTAFDVSSTGAISGVTTLSLSGSITGATTGTINGLSISSGALSGVTGFSQTSGTVGISGTGAINIGAGSNALTINSTAFDVSSTGALSGVTTLSMSGGITAATTGTINGLNISSGNLSGITGMTFTSGGLNLANGGITNAGAVSGVTTLSLSGAITGATATNTINGLIINAGSLSGITGFSQASGAFSVTGTGGITIGGGSNALTINSTAFDVTSAGAVSGVTTLAATGTISTTAGNISTSSGVFQQNGLSGVTEATCGNTQYLGGMRVSGGIITAADQCRSVGLSDQRLKTNVLSLEASVLDQVKNVDIVSFDFACDNAYFSSSNTYCDTRRQTGVLAQQVAQIFPDVTYQDEQGYYHVDYDALSMYSFRAVAEISKKLDSQGNAVLGSVTTGNELRLTATGALQNITGLTLTSGGASIIGGLNNNGSGITAAGAISGVTSIGAQSITLTADQNTNMLTLTKDGNGVFTVFNSGALELKLDSASALAVKSANGDNALTVDTLTGKVKIGAGNNGKTVLFVLDTKSSDGDPAGVNGAQYYNSKMNKFRCYQNDKWQDCLQTAFSEYGIMTQNQSWQQGNGEAEPAGEHRTWVDLSNANQLRILANVTTAGPQGSSCKLQYSLTDNNPDWKDVAETGQLAIDKTGALKSDWLQITDDAKAEVLIRVLCKGGTSGGVIEVNGIRMQVR